MLHVGIFLADIPNNDSTLLRGYNVANQISEETKNRTTRCNQEFKCLNNTNFQMCPVEDKIKEGIYFIKMVNPLRRCNYCLAFGDSHICRCPTRSELYERYKK